MTKKDLFRIIIRFFGLYSLIFALTSVLPMIPFVLFTGSIDIGVAVGVTIGILLLVALFVLVIGFPDVIINLLKLMNGFDDDQFVCNKESIFKLIGVILFITGGYLIIDNAVSLVVTVYNQISGSKFFSFFQVSEYVNIFKQIVLLVIGCYIVGNYKQVTEFFFKEKGSKNPTQY